ncbi:MAG: riboflavin synthase [candidate division WOR-3 bacterium]
MFAGIVEGRCKVVNFEDYGKGKRVWFEFENLKEFYTGQSISIDGVCLTVEEYESSRALFFLSDETLRRTKFGLTINTGYVCNYERSLKVGDRIDGHFVLGHVDGVGRIVRIDDYGDEGLDLYVEIPENLMVYVAEKGSIALDGTSLTVNGVRGNVISIRIIPQTLKITAFPFRKVGDLINVEVDVLARYVVNYLRRNG